MKLLIKTLVLSAMLICAWPANASALGTASFNISRDNPKSPNADFRFDLEPGETIEDHVVLKNTTNAPISLRISVADGKPTNNGGIALEDRADQQTGLAKWIAIDAPEVVPLGADEERNIWFRLSVPEHADGAEVVGGILAEEVETAKDESSDRSQPSVLAKKDILIFQRPPGPADIGLEITLFARELADGSSFFDLELENTGNVILQPVGTIDVSNIFGMKTDTIKLDRLPTIFPAQSNASRELWVNPPPIGYFTAEVNLEHENNGHESKKMHFLIFPWWLLPVPLVLWVIARQQRRRRATKKLDAEKLTEVEARGALDTLASTLDEIEVDLPAETGSADKAETVASAPVKTITPPTTKVQKAPAKRRGRPPKKKVDETGSASTTKTEKGATSVEAPKRKRGRPPKKATDEAKTAKAAKTETSE